jgi:hypothetical protein
MVSLHYYNSVQLTEAFRDYLQYNGRNLVSLLITRINYTLEVSTEILGIYQLKEN